MTIETASCPAGSAPDSGNVVSVAFSNHSLPTGGFPACRDLHAYWDALRGARQMPARSEFDPRGIERTLNCTFVAEKVAPSVARIRVNGSMMNDVLGMDVRGMPITAFFDPASREALSEATREVFANPAMTVLELSASRGFGRKPLRARMILLPMSDDHGQITRLVGCLDVAGVLGSGPRRFQITAIRSSELSGIAPTLRQVGAMQDRPAVEPRYAFAEAPLAFRSQREKPEKTPIHKGLRLVVSND